MDAYYERGVNYWDYAAGGLVATEAGARLGGLAGKPPGPAITIAAEPAMFGRMCDLLTRLRAEQDG